MRRAAVISLCAGIVGTLVLGSLIGAGGFPSRPRFQQITVGPGAVAPEGSIQVNNLVGYYATSTRPVYKFNETDATAGNRVWYMEASGEQFRARAVDDAELTATEWMKVDRTANVVDSIALAATSMTQTGTGHFGGTGVGFTVTPHLSVQQAGAANLGVRNTTNSVEGLLRAEGAAVILGAVTAHSLDIRTNNTARAIFSPGGESINFVATAVQTNGVDATAASGTYTATLTGCTTAPTVTAVYRKMGNIVTLRVPPATCTSNTTAFSLTGAPAIITPTTGDASTVQTLYGGINNGVTEYGLIACNMAPTGAVVCARNSSQTGFTASGTKGMGNALQLTYGLL